MDSRTYPRAVVLALLLAGFAWPLAAEEQEPPPRTFSSMLNVDALVDTYVRFVARKYNLNEEQDAFTEQLVRARVDEFLDQHREQVAALVDRLVEVRGGGDISPEELIQWGQRMQPIYDDAKGIILQTNDEWRGILTEEQRRMHDDDLKLMYESFTTTEDQLNRLTTGEMTVDEFRSPRRTLQARRQATVREHAATPNPTPTRAPQGAVRKLVAQRSADTASDASARRASADRGSAADPRPSARRANPTALRHSGQPARDAEQAGDSAKETESEWDRYVREFIERYQLDAEQQSRARKILKKCQEQAERYMRTRTPVLEKLDRQTAELQGSDAANKTQELAKLTEQRQRLLAPLDRIFEKQLKPRLERIPTRAQREAAEKRGTQKPAPREQKTSHKNTNQPANGGDD